MRNKMNEDSAINPFFVNQISVMIRWEIQNTRSYLSDQELAN